MRDPERIVEILDLINDIWQKDQDMRFMQLIYNLQSRYSHENGDFAKIEEVEKDGFSRIGYDMFCVEDDGFIEFLKKVKLKKN